MALKSELLDCFYLRLPCEERVLRVLVNLRIPSIIELVICDVMQFIN